MEFQILGRSATPDGWCCRVTIPEGHPAFEGHFPGHPVFPGIAHLALAAHVLATVTERTANVAAVPFLRLRHPVAPGDVLEVTLGRPAPDGTVPFDVRRGQDRVSNGILVVDLRE